MDHWLAQIATDHANTSITLLLGLLRRIIRFAEARGKVLRKVVKAAGLEGNWTPREFRHTFVSLMSYAGVREELIADLVGHQRTSTTRTVYRHQLRPVITAGAETLDGLFDSGQISAQVARIQALTCENTDHLVAD